MPPSSNWAEAYARARTCIRSLIGPDFRNGVPIRTMDEVNGIVETQPEIR